MGLLFRLVELLLLILPLVGLIAAGIKAISSMTRRAGDTSGDAAQQRVSGPEVSPRNDAAQWRAVRRALDAHEQTDTRWLQYELDAARLLDFPVMTDLRDPLTAAFHKAKLRAELHKPLRAEDLLDDRDAARQYLDAVQDYVTAFDAAESEAMRRRRSDFSHDENQRLNRAQSLLRVAADGGATAQERQRAYALARSEIDGLLVLPDKTLAGIERELAGEIDG